METTFWVWLYDLLTTEICVTEILHFISYKYYAKTKKFETVLNAHIKISVHKTEKLK